MKEKHLFSSLKMAEIEVKLSGKENFYKENPALWNSNDPHYKNKVHRSLIKVKLLTMFAEKYTEDVKDFHPFTNV